MAGIVRSSKFRHVFAEQPKLEKCFSSVIINKGPWESNMSSVNTKFIAISLETRGGGGFMVIPLDKPGRVDLKYPKISGHKDAVLDVQWNPFDENEIASASADGEVKLWTIPDGGITTDLVSADAKTTLVGHGKKVTRLAWHPCASDILASSGGDKVIIIWNTLDKTAIETLNGFPDSIYSFSWNYNGKYMAVAFKEGKEQKLRVYDVREKQIKQEVGTHLGGKPSHCIFLGTTNTVLTTGFTKTSERQYALWDAGDLGRGPLATEKIDTSSGVLMPFWNEGCKMFYLIGKGDTNIRYFEVTAQAPYTFFLNQTLTTVPHRGVCIAPCRNLEYMRCEVTRFYRLQHTKMLVEPTPMIVPRKSEMLQDDIFTTCAAGKASMTAAEWLSGGNKDPLLLKYTKEGLVELSESDSQISTEIRFKDKEAPKEKPQPDVLKRWGSGAGSDLPEVLVTLEDYKRGYKALSEENAKLKKELAELKEK